VQLARFAPTNTALPTGNNAAITLSSTAGSLGGVVAFNTTDETTNWELARHQWSSNFYTISTELGGSGTARGIVFSPRADQVQFRRGTNPQTVISFNTYTNSTNYEGFQFYWASNVIYLAQTFLGTGVARDMVIITEGASTIWHYTNNTARWSWDSSGHQIPAASATYDLGSTGSYVRVLYVGSVISAALTGGVGAGDDLSLSSTSHGTRGHISIGSSTDGVYVGNSSTCTLSFFGAALLAQIAIEATLTNNVTAGGSSNVIADYSSLTVYATDAAAIRNNIYQLARKLALLEAALKTTTGYGLVGV
jgi:hypothetical protein